jgi:hypothetical protein
MGHLNYMFEYKVSSVFIVEIVGKVSKLFASLLFSLYLDSDYVELVIVKIEVKDRNNYVF